MLGKVTPGNLVNFLSKEINYTSSPNLKSNSLVILKLLEKIGKNYKVLINGKIYQASLPIAAQKNETILAKVLIAKPLKLTLNNMFPQSGLNNKTTEGILSVLGLEKSETSGEIIKVLIDEGKHFSKEKIDQLNNFILRNNLPIDYIQLSFLVNLFWNDGNKKRKELYKRIPKIFDVSFIEIAEYISGFLDNNNFVQSANISTFLKDVFCIVSNGKEKLDFNFRTEKIVKYLSLFEKEFNLPPLSELRTYLLKYILQKSIFNELNFYTDFYFVSTKKGVIINFLKYQKTSDKAFNTILLMNTAFNGAEIESLQAECRYTNAKFYIMLIGKKELFNSLYRLENNLYAELTSIFSIPINITHKIKTVKNNLNSGNIDFMA